MLLNNIYAPSKEVEHLKNLWLIPLDDYNAPLKGVEHLSQVSPPTSDALEQPMSTVKTGPRLLPAWSTQNLGNVWALLPTSTWREMIKWLQILVLGFPEGSGSVPAHCLIMDNHEFYSWAKVSSTPSEWRNWLTEVQMDKKFAKLFDWIIL